MSEGRLPDRIDPYQLAESRRILEGRLSVAPMKRLGTYLASDAGEARLHLEFGVDDEGIRYARGWIRAELTLSCQRCLGAVQLPIEAEVHLGMIWDESLAERLPEHYEPLVVDDGPLYLSDIVEDELILALPVVPRHADETCAGTLAAEPEADTGDGDREANPFAALAKLKTNRES